jgi:hypothetical protein
VLEALEEQANYVPTVNVRLASIAQFILRVARHEKWEAEARKLLLAWAGEQTSVQEDDVATALTWWITGEGWQPGVDFTPTALNKVLCEVMQKHGHGYRSEDLDWRGSAESLGKRISRNLKVYINHFGLERSKSKAHNTRGGFGYRFIPSKEQLAALHQVVAEEAGAEAEIKRVSHLPF